jgi:hypothetical protein
VRVTAKDGQQQFNGCLYHNSHWKLRWRTRKNGQYQTPDLEPETRPKCVGYCTFQSMPVECWPRRSLFFKGDYFVDAQLQCLGHLLQALDRHASVASGFVALNLLLRESHSLGQCLLSEIADDPRLD